MDICVLSLDAGEKPGCPICTSAVSSLLRDRKLGRDYFMCGECGFIFTDPSEYLPVSEQKLRYLRHNNGLQERGYIRFLDSFLQKTVKPYVRTGERILDFGSGPVPAFSHLLTQHGYRADSYDHYFLPDRSWESRVYAAVVLIEVLEHITDPLPTLKKLKERLAPGGYFLVRTGLHDEDISHFSSWWYRQDPTHISFFSKKTAACLADLLDMDLVKIDSDKDIILQLPSSI